MYFSSIPSRALQTIWYRSYVRARRHSGDADTVNVPALEITSNYYGWLERVNKLKLLGVLISEEAALRNERFLRGLLRTPPTSQLLVFQSIVKRKSRNRSENECIRSSIKISGHLYLELGIKQLCCLNIS